MRPSFYQRLFALLVALASAAPAAASSRLAVAWHDDATGSGRIQAISTASPWNHLTAPLTVAADPILRFGQQSLFVLSPTDDSLQIVDPQSWAVDRTYPLPTGTAPTDVAVIDAQTAVISPNNSNELLRLDLDTGAVTPFADLGPLFDEQVTSDLGTMIVHDDRLFVQIQFAISTAPGNPVLPGGLAVIDRNTGALIDADPVLPGTQLVELDGTGPKFKMQIVPSTDELFVSASGSFFDEGGIEVIDLVTLATKGLIIEEADETTAADLSAFVMTTPDDGFLTFSTDFATSSHLVQFTRDTGVIPQELHVSVPYRAPALVHDPASNQLFLPQGGFIGPGIRVFDATTAAQLTTEVIPLGGDPTDLVLFQVVPEPSAIVLLFALAVAGSCVRPARRR